MVPEVDKVVLTLPQVETAIFMKSFEQHEPRSLAFFGPKFGYLPPWPLGPWLGSSSSSTPSYLHHGRVNKDIRGHGHH